MTPAGTASDPALGTPLHISPSPVRADPRVLRGWARATGSVAHVLGPTHTAAIADLLASRPPRGVLARGGGCSYGDAAQNAGGLVLDPVTTEGIEVDQDAATVHVSASVTFGRLVAVCVRRGLLPPVLPGTRHLTVGGAVAADVHGKNHRRDGSISAWLDAVELVGGDGHLRTLTADSDPELFRATVGGMGLTGVVTAATLRLERVRSTRMQVTVRRADDLDALMAGLESATTRYAVAWVDGTAAGRALGRGVLDLGDHEEEPEMTELAYHPPPVLTVPPFPVRTVTAATARAFNAAWFRKTPRLKHGTTGLPEFFHRLDAVSRWDRVAGRRGFLQYQLAVPAESARVVGRALEEVQRRGVPCFLGTLKRFGPGSGNPLSFASDGWSLALDMPARGPGLPETLDGLDRMVADAGGRVYLAKDARVSPGCFRAMYPQVDAWLEVKARVDPAGTMRSDLGRRLGLCR